VQDTLTALAERLEAVTLRIRTIGLCRAADDLRKVSTELRRLALAPTTGARPGGPSEASELGLLVPPT
jgi:hypothetical protein